MNEDRALHEELERAARRATIFCAEDRMHPVLELEPSDEQEVTAEWLPPGDRHATLPDPQGWRIPEWATHDDDDAV